MKLLLQKRNYCLVILGAFAQGPTIRGTVCLDIIELHQLSTKPLVANPAKNAEEIIKLIQEAHTKEVSVVVFPELTLTGYTASDLLLNQTLIASQDEALNIY